MRILITAGRQLAVDKLFCDNFFLSILDGRRVWRQQNISNICVPTVQKFNVEAVFLSSFRISWWCSGWEILLNSCVKVHSEEKNCFETKIKSYGSPGASIVSDAAALVAEESNVGYEMTGSIAIFIGIGGEWISRFRRSPSMKHDSLIPTWTISTFYMWHAMQNRSFGCKN